MIYNDRILHDACGFYPVEYEGMKGLGQSTDQIHLLSGKPYQWKVVAGDKILIRALTEYSPELFSTSELCGQFILFHF